MSCHINCSREGILTVENMVVATTLAALTAHTKPVTIGCSVGLATLITSLAMRIFGNSLPERGCQPLIVGVSILLGCCFGALIFKLPLPYILIMTLASSILSLALIH